MLNTTYLSHRALRAVSQRLPGWNLLVNVTGVYLLEEISGLKLSHPFLFPSIPYQRSLPETDLLEEVWHHRHPCPWHKHETWDMKVDVMADATQSIFLSCNEVLKENVLSKEQSWKKGTMMDCWGKTRSKLLEFFIRCVFCTLLGGPKSTSDVLWHQLREWRDQKLWAYNL